MKNKIYTYLIDNLPNKNVIYVLIDPNTDEVRYVGKAIDLYTRIKNHYKPSRLITKTHKNNWLNKLLSENKYVKINVVEELENYDLLNKAEIKWIKFYKELGCDLTNGTEGGDGGKMSPESIEKMKKTKTGKPHSKKHREAISKANIGHIVTNETKLKIGAKNKSKIVSDETKLKMSESHKGQTSWNKGKSPSLETKNKMRLARLKILSTIEPK